ncbi:hypothetical protein ACH4GP_31590 [Streptomyces celluloflavus]|uniref:Uncharacterized protein n=1 Tax=Streptomyces celluloflavus TaxID=58344 RepID=A0ABW7RLA9_9ACTN
MAVFLCRQVHRCVLRRMGGRRAGRPAGHDPSRPEDFHAKLSFWDSFLKWLSAGPWTFAWVGLPSLLLLLLISGRSARMESGEFRLLASGLFMIPMLWSLLFAPGAVWLLVPAAQILFTFWLMPLPAKGGASEQR